MKRCSNCGDWKAFTSFHKRKELKDGHRSVCKECRKHENPSAKVRMANHYAANPETKKMTDRKYRETHKDEIKVRNKVNHALRKTTGHLTGDVWRSIVKKHDGRCARCGLKLGMDLTVDHVVPVSKGGPNFSSNLQPLCGSCNSKKGVNFIPFELLHARRHEGLTTYVI